MSIIENILKRKDDVSDLEDQVEREEVKGRLQALKTESAERKAIEGELRKKYGAGWKKFLALNKWMDVATLNSIVREDARGAIRVVRRKRIG